MGSLQLISNNAFHFVTGCSNEWIINSPTLKPHRKFYPRTIHARKLQGSSMSVWNVIKMNTHDGMCEQFRYILNQPLLWRPDGPSNSMRKDLYLWPTGCFIMGSTTRDTKSLPCPLSRRHLLSGISLSTSQHKSIKNCTSASPTFMHIPFTYNHFIIW
jgi:hypothetical protein